MCHVLICVKEIHGHYHVNDRSRF